MCSYADRPVSNRCWGDVGACAEPGWLLRSTVECAAGEVGADSIYGVLHRECGRLFANGMFADVGARSNEYRHQRGLPAAGRADDRAEAAASGFDDFGESLANDIGQQEFTGELVDESGGGTAGYGILSPSGIGHQPESGIAVRSGGQRSDANERCCGCWRLQVLLMGSTRSDGSRFSPRSGRPPVKVSTMVRVKQPA